MINSPFVVFFVLFILTLQLFPMQGFKENSRILFHSTKIWKPSFQMKRLTSRTLSTVSSTNLYANNPKKSPPTTSKSKQLRSKSKEEHKKKETAPATAPVVDSRNHNVPRIDPAKVTYDEFHAAAKALRKLFLGKKIVEMSNLCADQGTFTGEMAYCALIQLFTGGRSDLAPELISTFYRNSDRILELQSKVSLAKDIVIILCKCRAVEEATRVAKTVGALASPTSDGNELVESPERNDTTTALHYEILGNLALCYVSKFNFRKGYEILQQLYSIRIPNSTIPILSDEISFQIFKNLLQNANVSTIFKYIDLLRSLKKLNDQQSAHVLSTHMMKSVEFIKGAVSVETLPKLKHPEIIFMGRSNVGKSSLINMITNRKQIAYTSKQPGKTTEFNYYLSKGSIGKDKIPQDFYLVDLPGVGFARRSHELREKWVNFMKDYVQNRESVLKCVFHLIDSRRGIMEADYNCFDLLPLLPPSVEYVVVFTKTDKQNSNSPLYRNGVSRVILSETEEELKKLTGGEREIPILFSSSESKLGGVDILTTIMKRLVPTSPEEEMETGEEAPRTDPSLLED